MEASYQETLERIREMKEAIFTEFPNLVTIEIKEEGDKPLLMFYFVEGDFEVDPVAKKDAEATMTWGSQYRQVTTAIKILPFCLGQ